MNSAKGYYCLIQYCPDLSRQEAANIGVLFFCPELNFLRARVSRGNDRIRRFFGSVNGDREQIKAIKASIEERLEVEKSYFRTVKDLEKFIATRANEIQITSPLPMKVFDPEKDLESLFQRLVGGRATPVRKDNTVSVKTLLSEALSRKEIVPFVRKDVTVPVPALHRELRVPFAYRNGRFNLIQPESFQRSSPTDVINVACRHAVEGHSLYKHPHPDYGELQLVVVAEFPQNEQNETRTVRDILQENDVRLYTTEDLEDLLKDIQATGRLV